MTPLDWWMLGGSTSAGLVTVFRWQVLTAAHAVRGAWRRLPEQRPVLRWQVVSAAHAVRGWWRRLRFHARRPRRVEWMTMESIEGLRRRRAVASAAGQCPVGEPGTMRRYPPPPPVGRGAPSSLPGDCGYPQAADAPIRVVLGACGCDPGSDPADCPTRLDVTPLIAREREYMHGGPPERGGRPDWVKSEESRS